MATQIDLCNRALTRCGALRIMDLSENTKPARAIAAVYAGVRDSCLSMANWRFAMKRITLANEHALSVLADLNDGAYYVVVVNEDLTNMPFVAPRGGASFMVDDKWIVFSPVENAN